MKKTLFLSAIALLVTSNMYAGTVTVSDAHSVALNFFKSNVAGLNNHIALNAILKYTQTAGGNTADFYVFDISPVKGYVMVAADDNVIPVLAYSTESNFQGDFTQPGLNHWMRKITGNIRLALQHNAVADARIKNLWSAYRMGQNVPGLRSIPVAPLCTTTWDQENDFTNPPPYLYNLFCPYNNHQGQRCVTGCVATAMAQIMKYWNYPAVGTGAFSYNDTRANGYSNNYGTLSSNFASHNYQWPLMPSMLTGDEPLAQDSAVDLLMYDCGVSVGMDYGDDNQGGSGAEGLLSIELSQFDDSLCSQYALTNYFSYNLDSINGIQEFDYSGPQWISFIENELDNGRPVLYEGNDTTQGGHAWVCDGYDANDYLHMNWGWSGFDNGYFAINNLTTAGNFNPVLEDAALIGIVPSYPNAPVANFAATFTSTCNGTIQFNDFSINRPASWLWNFGDDSTSTQQNPVHTYAANGTYSVSLTVTNPAGQTSKAVNDYITINMLPAPTATNVAVAGAQTFSLSAVTSNTVGWFDEQGVPVSSANPFITPVLSNTTTYYVEDSVVSPSVNVGPAHEISNDNFYLNDPISTQFIVNSPCVIQSVYIYALSSANRTIQVTDSSGNIITQTTVYCAAPGGRVTLNFNVDAGGPYYLGFADTIGPYFYFDSSGANYPYTEPGGLLSITGNNLLEPTSYFYFYDWIVKAPDCVSPRLPVVVNVTTGINETMQQLSFDIFPNPASNVVILQTTGNSDGLTWKLVDILGQTLMNNRVEVPQTHINTSNLSAGVYLVELQSGDKTAIKKLVINR